MTKKQAEVQAVPKLIKLSSAAKELGISHSLMYTLIKRGKLRAVQPFGKGGGWLIARAELDRFMEGLFTGSLP